MQHAQNLDTVLQWCEVQHVASDTTATDTTAQLRPSLSTVRHFCQALSNVFDAQQLGVCHLRGGLAVQMPDVDQVTPCGARTFYTFYDRHALGSLGISFSTRCCNNLRHVQRSIVTAVDAFLNGSAEIV
ncbi:MAG: hypothetical protein AAF730_17605 [Bacteroidota bacterium]